MSRSTLIVPLALGALLLLAPGASSRSLDTTVPQLLEPADGAVHLAGTPIVFRARTHSGDSLWMLVSKSPSAVHECGKIDSDVRTYSMQPTSEDPSVYEVRPPNYTFSTYWLVAPGTYYWQVHRIEHHDANGCVPSEVRSLVVKAGGGGTTTTTRTTTTRTTTTTAPTTPKPPKKALPLGMARLQGDFDVRYRITSSNSFNERVGSRGSFSWSFKPGCSRGACSAKVNLDGNGSFRLAKGGAAYRGSGKARLTTCLMAPQWGTSSIGITVKQGVWSEGKWLAKRWTGTLSHSWPSHGSCAGGSFSASVAGTVELA